MFITIVDRFGLSLKNCLACQRDHASTNNGCLFLIKENFKDINPTKTTVAHMD